MKRDLAAGDALPQITIKTALVKASKTSRLALARSDTAVRVGQGRAGLQLSSKGL